MRALQLGFDSEEEAIRVLLRILSPIMNCVINSFSVNRYIYYVNGFSGTYSAAGVGGLVVVSRAWFAGLIIAIGGNFTTLGAFLLIGGVFSRSICL
jgi:hypothetical protein